MALIILILVIVFACYVGNSFGSALKNQARKVQSVQLSEDFASLGDLKTHSYMEIVSKCGAPSSSQLIKDENGVSCYRKTWWSPRYEIAVIFETDNKVRYIEKEVRR